MSKFLSALLYKLAILSFFVGSAFTVLLVIVLPGREAGATVHAADVIVVRSTLIAVASGIVTLLVWMGLMIASEKVLPSSTTESSMHTHCTSCNAAFANPTDEPVCAVCDRGMEAEWSDDHFAKYEVEWFAEQDGKHTLVG